jgi:deoxyribodipyrimidine photo-lyase
MRPDPMTAILWHQNDLRLDDNEALTRALAQHERVIPVYCVDPRHFADTDLGFRKSGPFRARFLVESLHDLRRRYNEIGSDLVVRNGRPEDLLPELVETTGATHIYFHEEATSEELKVERALRAQIDLTFVPFWGSTLYHRDDLPFPVDDLPHVFTNLRKGLEKNASIREPLDAPSTMPPIPDELDVGAIPTLKELGYDSIDDDSRAVLRFVGGEAAARDRLDHYFWDADCLRRYKSTRNGLLGPDYSSKFSPWLANGSLSPRRVHAEVRRYETERTSNKSTYWMIFELIWRDFFRFHALAEGNRLFYITGFRDADKHWKHDHAAFDAWRKGETGVPFVDANMREMARTGFMSNRGRQNVASFLAQNLEVDWRWGAAWFEHCLLDHDPASNYGNWQYVSGVGHDPRDRWFNVLSQAERYDKKGKYTRTWCPELTPLPDATLQTPWEDDLERYDLKLGDDYPRPILDLEASHRRLRAR